MVVIGRLSGPGGVRSFLERLDVQGPIYIVKPSWRSASSYTSADTLDQLFSALKGTVKVVEGYALSRSKDSLKGERQDMDLASPKKKWRWIKEQDDWFLRFSRSAEVLERHNVEYINVTEEVWSLKTLDPDEVRDFVDRKYGVLVSQDMYGSVPSRLYELRGSTLLSLCSIDGKSERLTFSTENLFGLIPDPARLQRWAGNSDDHKSQSVVDINKIYRSLFSPCYWINEIEELNVLVGSKNSLEADAATAALMGIDLGAIYYSKHAAQVFGGFDKRVLTNLTKLL